MSGIFPANDPRYAAAYAEESAMVDSAELIAEALQGSGLSQSDLARALGVSRSEVSARLAGERNITVRKLAASLHAMGYRLELSISREPRRTQRREPAWSNVAVSSEVLGLGRSREHHERPTERELADTILNEGR